MMGLGASMVSKPELEFKGPPDYWVTTEWLFHINEDGEFRPSLGLLEKLLGAQGCGQPYQIRAQGDWEYPTIVG